MRVERQQDVEMTGPVKTNDRKSAALPDSGSQLAGDDSVSISNLGSALNGLDQLGNGDSSRINELRAAVGQGHYSVDSLAISRRLVQEVLARA